MMIGEFDTLTEKGDSLVRRKSIGVPSKTVQVKKTRERTSVEGTGVSLDNKRKYCTYC